MKIKRCLKLLFRQTLYALALILWVALVVVGGLLLLGCCCCCRVSGKFVCAFVNVVFFVTLLLAWD